MGKKLAEKLIVVITQFQNKTLVTVLYGLGIRHISVNAQLFQHTVEQLAEAEPEATVYGIGSEIAQSIHQWFRIPANQT